MFADFIKFAISHKHISNCHGLHRSSQNRMNLNQEDHNNFASIAKCFYTMINVINFNDCHNMDELVKAITTVLFCLTVMI